MVSKDTVIGIVGAVILVAAMVGVFYYEGAQGAGSTGGNGYHVEWTTEQGNGPQASGETSEGDASNTTLEVAQANLTGITFTLVWADDVGQPDRFKLTVTAPDGSVSNTTEGASGEVAVQFTGLNAVPEGREVFADSEAEARASLADQYTKRQGTGEWTVRVELLDAGDFQPIPGAPAVQEDTGNAWELKTTLSHYKPDLKKSS